MPYKGDLNMGDRKASGSKENFKKFREEIVHQFHVISEDVISQVKQVAEGVANVDEKLDRRFNELKAKIDNKTHPIAQAVVELSGKVAGLDGKVDRASQELRTAIQETRQEVLQPLNSHMRNWTNGLPLSKRNFSNSNIASKK